MPSCLCAKDSGRFPKIFLKQTPEGCVEGQMIFGMEGRIVGGLLPVVAVMAGCLGLVSLARMARAAEAPAAEV